jgi:RNA polymerase sigma-70 factor (ECF subfamily)
MIHRSTPQEVRAMFLNWQHSTNFVSVVLTFRVGTRVVRVPVAELAQLPLARRTKVHPVMPATLTMSPLEACPSLKEPFGIPKQRKDPDRARWRRAQQGDETAYEQLRRKHRALVNGEIRKRLHRVNNDDLQDLEQDVWIAVWESLPRFRGDATFHTWVVGIAKHVLFNWLRRKKTEEQAIARIIQNVRCANEEAHESHFLVHEAIKNLRATAREVIYLRYFLQLTDEEIAQRLGVPLGTVKSRIRAGLMQLKVAL